MSRGVPSVICIHTFYDNPLLLAKEDVHNSYSNPIWGSKWNIKDLYLGNSDTDFARRFRDDHLIREIVEDDVDNALESIADLGEPLRRSDKEAHEETMSILNWLKVWTSKDDVIVVMADEL